MKRTVIITLILIGLVAATKAQHKVERNLLLKTTHYDLDVRMDYDNRKLAATCAMTVVNENSKISRIVPILLYRLMKVSSIKDEKGQPLVYTQQVLAFEDWEVCQVNYLEVTPAEPLSKGDSCKMIIEYEGYLLGYVETGMNYVKDKIDPEFTILRPDGKAFPELGYPSVRANTAAGFAPSFNYTVKIRVPDSLTVANGGALVSVETKNGYSTYIYRNTKLSWRIDVAIGKYKILETPLLKIYYLEQDSAGAETVYKYAERTLHLYSAWWGNLKETVTFSIVEVPDGYGSQADETCILQTADVFNDSTQMRQLYHELSHLWNVKSNDEFCPRWNEGLATFIEYLTIEKLENRPYLDYVSDWFLNRLRTDIEKDSTLRQIPMIDFGRSGVQSNSYSVGMVMFRLLHQVMGESDFNKLIGTYYFDYYLNGGTTDQLVETAKTTSTANLARFFDDWLYSTKYTQLIRKGLTLDEMSKLYR